MKTQMYSGFQRFLLLKKYIFPAQLL